MVSISVLQSLHNPSPREATLTLCPTGKAPWPIRQPNMRILGSTAIFAIVFPQCRLRNPLCISLKQPMVARTGRVDSSGVVPPYNCVLKCPSYWAFQNPLGIA
ncbi:hypothetical protein V6N13_142421 [Hibiscus sabdariffa]